MAKTKLPTIDMAAASEEATAGVKEATQYLEHIEKMEIVNDAELKFAVGVTAEIKEKHGEVDDQRRKFTDAAQAIIDEANAFFKPALKSLKQCETVLKEKVLEFDQRQAKRRDELLGAAGEVSAGPDANPEKAKAFLEEADTCIVPKIPGLSLRRAVKIDVTDASEAIQWCIDNDRTELLQLNEKAIKVLAKAANGHGLEIPGVKATPSATVAITVSEVERA